MRAWGLTATYLAIGTKQKPQNGIAKLGPELQCVRFITVLSVIAAFGFIRLQLQTEFQQKLPCAT